MKKKSEWRKNSATGNHVLDDGGGKVFLSYQPNDFPNDFFGGTRSGLDSCNPETAIVILNDKRMGDKLTNRYLIYRGDWRNKLEKLYPNVDKLKKHWAKHGGHFWSDSLDNEPT